MPYYVGSCLSGGSCKNMKKTTVVPFVAGDNDSQQVELRKERRNSRPEEPCQMKIGDYELYKVLQPLLLTMRVFGFCSLSKDALSKGLTSISYTCYSLFSLMIVYVNAYFILAKLKGINSLDEMIPVAGKTVWLVFSTFLATMLVVMNVRRKVWQELFTSYETATGGIWRFTGHALTQKRVYIYVLFCWLWSILNTGFFIYTEILSSEDLALSILSLVGIAHVSICWVAPFAIVMILTDILATNFGQFNARLRDAYNSSSLESLGVIRSMHLRLSRMVVVSDNILCRITAAHITSNLLILSCMIYIVIYNIQDFKSDPVNIAFHMNCIIGVCVIMFGTMAACARVKEEVGWLNHCNTFHNSRYTFEIMKVLYKFKCSISKVNIVLDRGI